MTILDAVVDGILWVAIIVLGITALATAYDEFHDVTGPRKAVIPVLLAAILAVVLAARTMS